MDQPAAESGLTPEEFEIAGRLRELPREVGVMLVAVGALGFVLPGIAGTPAIVAGGLVLWPDGFQKVETWLGRRFPKVHRTGARQIGRYLDDLQRRFPHPPTTSEARP